MSETIEEAKRVAALAEGATGIMIKVSLLTSLITTIESLQNESVKQVQTIGILKEHLATSEQECGKNAFIESQKEEIEQLEAKLKRIIQLVSIRP